MTLASQNQLLERIQALQPDQVAEVESFVEFLASKSLRRSALDRLLAVAPALHGAEVDPPTEEEIAAEVRAVRGARRRVPTTVP